MARGYGLDSVGRLDISIFYDGDPDWWLRKADAIFARNQLSEWEKIEAAAACWCGEAWEWFLWIESRRPIRTWDELKCLLRDRFGKKEVMKPDLQKDMTTIMKELDLMIKKMGGRKGSSSDEIGAITLESEKKEAIQKSVASVTLPKAAMNRSLEEDILIKELKFTRTSEIFLKLDESGACNGGSNHQDKPGKAKLAGPKLFKPGISDEEEKTAESFPTRTVTVAEKPAKEAPPFKWPTNVDPQSKKEKELQEEKPYVVEGSSCVGLIEEKRKVTTKNREENGLETRAEINKEKHMGLGFGMAQFVEGKLQLKPTQGKVGPIYNTLNNRLIWTIGRQLKVPFEASGEYQSGKHAENFGCSIQYSEGNLQPSKGRMFQEDKSERVAQAEDGFVGKKNSTNFSVSVGEKQILLTESRHCKNEIVGKRKEPGFRSHSPKVGHIDFTNRSTWVNNQGKVLQREHSDLGWGDFSGFIVDEPVVFDETPNSKKHVEWENSFKTSEIKGNLSHLGEGATLETCLTLSFQLACSFHFKFNESGAHFHINQQVGLGWERAYQVEGNHLLFKQGQQESSLIGNTSIIVSNTRNTVTCSPFSKISIAPKFVKSKQSQPLNQLTVSELQKRMENGFCLHCDETNPVGHNCENKELQVLVVTGNLEMVCFVEVENGDGEKMELPTRIKLQGKINHDHMILLTDGASSCKLFSTHLVQKLDILKVEATGYGVALDTILVIVARLSWSIHFKGLKRPSFTMTMAGFLTKEVVLYDELIKREYFHLEDKVDFGAAGSDRPPPPIQAAKEFETELKKDNDSPMESPAENITTASEEEKQEAKVSSMESS